jgi:hypothetical protein
MDWITVAQDRGRWPAFVNAVMNLRVIPQIYHVVRNDRGTNRQTGFLHSSFIRLTSPSIKVL